MSCITRYSEPVPAPFGRSIEEAACVGVGLNLEQLKAQWATFDCLSLFNSIIYSGPFRSYSASGFRQVEYDFEYLFSTYYSITLGQDRKGGHTVSLPGQIGYDNFQDTLISACTGVESAIAGACQGALTRMCSTCSREEVSNSAPLLQYCGCMIPSLSPDNYPGITPACDSLCVQDRVSKRRDAETGQIEQCQGAVVCVIDNVSITASKSITGGVSFTQVCPQCRPPNVCICIIDQTTPTAAETTGLSNPVTFRQYCGENGICLVVDPATQQTQEVECDLEPVRAEQYYFPVPIWAWALALLIVVVGVLITVAWLQEERRLTTKPQ